jgi:hypothetical protein
MEVMLMTSLSVLEVMDILLLASRSAVATSSTILLTPRIVFFSGTCKQIRCAVNC